MWKTLVAAALFVAFVPGVMITIPAKGSKWTVLVVHALLFAVVTHFVMKQLRHEYFGNYGPTCPNGSSMKEDGTCVAVGQPTYEVNTGFQHQSK